MNDPVVALAATWRQTWLDHHSLVMRATNDRSISTGFARAVRELRFAARRLVGARAFTSVSLLTLSSGAAAVGAVFSIAYALFIAPLPYPDAERIVVLNGEMRRADVQSWPVGVMDLADVRAAQPGMLGPVPVAGGRGFSVRLGDGTEHVAGELVGADYLSVFGLGVSQGRFFTAEEEAQREPTAAVISHRAWQQYFGGADDVVGRLLTVNDRRVEIVGIGPAGFRGLYDSADLFLPVGSAATFYQPGYLDVREFRWLAGVGRLSSGSTVAAVTDRIETTLRGLEPTYPTEYRDFHLTVETLPAFLFGDITQPVWLLVGASVLVLAIACTNLASLFFARGLGRQRETALRRALGARTGQVVSPVVAELVLLVLVAASLGLLVAYGVVGPLVGMAGSEIPSFVRPGIDPVVIVATFAACLLVSTAFAFGPALYAGRVDLTSSLRSTGSATTLGRGQRRMHATLVALQATLAVTLLCGTGLLLRGLDALLRTNLGFSAEGVTMMRLNMASERYQANEAYAALAVDLLDRTRALPGVSSAALEGPGYPTYGAYGFHLWNDNTGGEPVDVMTHRHHVTPGYFETLGVTLRAGRDFALTDRGDGGPVMVVSRTLADRVWPGGDAVGKTIRTSRGTPLTFTVIGVVDDVRHQGLSSTTFTAPQVYISLLQFPAKSPASMTLLVKSDGPAVPSGTLRDLMKAADPNVPIVEARPLSDVVREQTGQNRLLALLVGGFAAIALFLAAIGVYGVVAFSVQQAQRELGIRLAMGASGGMVVRHMVRRGVTPVAIGIGLGIVLLPAVQSITSSQLHGVSPFDPFALGAAVALLGVVAIAAALAPAWRAARVDPLVTLRGD